MRTLIALIAVGLLTACGPAKKAETNGKKKVVCTIGMIADVARNIGGDRTEVIHLMGSGVDPHLYKASAGDVARLQEADLILFNGLHLEAKMGEILEKMEGNIKTVAVSELVAKDKLLEEEEGVADPHLWFNVALWKEVAGNIRDAMVSADPDGKSVYDSNFEAYAKKLDELDAYVKRRAEELPEGQRVLVTAHDAFNYFGNAYGFEVMGLQGISTVSEAGTADVQKLAKTIADRKIKAIFIESSVPRRNVEALQEAVKAQGFNVKIGGELFSDAMGSDGTVEGTYIGMVTHNIDMIVEALSGH